MATKTARTKKVAKDETPPAPVEQSSPFVEPPAIQPTPEPSAAEQKAAQKASEASQLAAKKLAEEKDKADEKRRKEEATRTVTVRAIRVGQYPANGKLRKIGEVFDYVLHKKTDGTLEEKLPSWMVHVDGDMKSREQGEPSAAPDQPTVIEIRGSGPDATITKGRTAAGGRSVL